MTRVLVVPGAAVRGYVRPAVHELRDVGVDAELLAAPGEPGTPAELAAYGRVLGARIEAAADRFGPVDLLIGLSVGAQVAAVAAAHPAPTGSPVIRRVMLVSPTVDP
ncbi:MAG: hypothetical protein M3235_21200, partial [Actinomycetota bacterium]|nr:hypothetical protein [Actinomycetota bacterium]